MKKLFLLMFLLVVTLGFGEEIKIGVIYPKSGELSNYGESALNGFRYLIDRVNEDGGIGGKNLVLIERDNGGEPMKSIEAFKSLEKEGVIVVFGPLLSDNCRVLGKLSYESNLPIISPTATSAELIKENDYFFRSCFSDSQEGNRMANFAVKDLESKKAVVLFDEDSNYSLNLLKSFEREYLKGGGELIEKIELGDVRIDFLGELSELKESGLDTIYITYENVSEKIFKELAEIVPNIKILGIGDWRSEEFVFGKDISILEAYVLLEFVESELYDINEEFFIGYRESYGKKSDELSVLGYDAGVLLIEAMKSIDKIERESILEALFLVKSVTAVSGKLSVGSDRNIEKKMFVSKYSNGKWNVLKKK